MAISDINRMEKENVNGDNRWGFYGNGFGENEGFSRNVTKEALLNYMEYCKQQIALCEEYVALAEASIDDDGEVSEKYCGF